MTAGRTKTSLYIALIVGFWGASLAWWHRGETRPPAWDESVHLHLALDYAAALTKGVPVTVSWASVYPPLYHLSLMPFVAPGIPVQSRTLGAHLLYATLFMLAIAYFLRRRKFPPEAVLGVGLLFAACTLVVFTARRPLIDFALTAWVTAAMAVLFASDRFQNRGLTLLFGVLCGLGFLLKPQYGFFFVIPVLVALYEEPPDRRVLKTLFLAFALCAGIAALWYGWQGAYFLKNAIYLGAERGTAEGDPSFRTPAGMLFYVRALWKQFGPAALAVTVIGWALLPFDRDRPRRWIGFLLAWVASGYLMMTIVNNKDERYTLPMLPALLLLSAAGWRRWLEKPAGRTVFLTLAAGACAWTTLHFDQPVREEWPHLAMGRLIEAERDRRRPFPLVSLLSNHVSFFPRNLRFVLRSHGQQIGAASPGDPTRDFTEFLITKSGDLGPDSDDLRKEWDKVKQSGRAYKLLYPQIKTFPLPDGSVATIYKRDPSHRFAISGLSPQALEERIAKVAAARIKGPLKVQVDSSSADLTRGRITKATISGGPWMVRDLPLARGEIVAEKVWLNLYHVWDHNGLGLMAFERLTPKATIKADDVEALLKRKAKGVRDPQVRFEKGKVLLKLSLHGIPLAARARVDIEQGRALYLVTEHLSIGPVPLPGFLFGKIHRYAVPLEPIHSFPGTLNIKTVRIEDGVIQIN
jgi:hypothetical protein